MEPWTITYQGQSMRPLFRAGDQLQVCPCSNRELKRGDVVLFRDRNSREYIVHRIAARMPDGGIVTHGDNNPGRDSELLNAANIIGKVVARRRDNRRRKVYGGWRGHLYLQSLKTLKMLEREMISRLSPIYQYLSRHQRLREWLSGREETRIVCFQRPEGPDFIMVWKNKTVGRWDGKNGRWLIYRPYKLLVNEAELPPTLGSISFPPQENTF